MKLLMIHVSWLQPTANSSNLNPSAATILQRLDPDGVAERVSNFSLV